MMKIALVALALVAVASAELTPRQKAVSHLLETLENRDVFCDVCVVIIQDLDDFITSDTTEEEIIQFIENVSAFDKFNSYSTS